MNSNGFALTGLSGMLGSTSVALILITNNIALKSLLVGHDKEINESKQQKDGNVMYSSL